MKLMVFDCETTGLEWKKDKIIEFGAALFDFESGKPLYLQADNILYDGELTDEIKKITGIEQEMIRAPLAVNLKNVMFRFTRIAALADYYVGHNVQFDLDFILAACEETGFTLSDKPVIDTRYDLPYSPDQSTFKLNYLLADHKLFNPYAHRALFDCMSTFALLREYDIEETILNAKSETIEIMADVGFRAKDLARGMGFYWDGARKKWLLKIKKRRYEKIKKDFPFKTKIEFEIPFG